MSYIKRYMELCQEAGLNPEKGYHHEIALQVEAERHSAEAEAVVKYYNELQGRIERLFGHGATIAVQVSNLPASIVSRLQKEEDGVIRRPYPLPFDETEAAFLFATPKEGLYLQSVPMEFVESPTQQAVA